MGGIATLVFVMLVNFFPPLQARLHINDAALGERKLYNQTGLNIIRASSFNGVGIGTVVLHMQQYSPHFLQPWEKQPPHNYFIVAGAEGGVLVVVLLLYFFIRLIHGGFKYSSVNILNQNYPVTLGVVLVGFILLMQTDHYFWTIPQAQLLLWMFFGLMAGVSEKELSHL